MNENISKIIGGSMERSGIETPIIRSASGDIIPKLKIVMDIDATMIYTEKKLTFKYANKIVENYEEIQFEMENNIYYSKLRPGLTDFITSLSKIADMYIFTSASSTYANIIAKLLDPDGKIFKKIWSVEDITIQHINYQSECDQLSYNINIRKTYAKDLKKVFGDKYDPSHTILIDDNKDYHALNPDNGIHIPYFNPYNFFEDTVLSDIFEFIMDELIHIEDVRPILCKKYFLRHKNNVDALNATRSFQF